jgi:competence protein ComFC
MPVVTTHPMSIKGPWDQGYVLDFHTISSMPTGDPYHPFDTKRTELGELVYRLKYGGNLTAFASIADTAEDFLRNRWRPPLTFDALVPAPPSLSTRKKQPVIDLARELASRFNVPVREDIALKAKPTPQMKNVAIWERQEMLNEAIQKGPAEATGLRILLLDDLIESSSTLRRVAEVVRGSGASAVYALVLTRTK